MVNEVSQRWAPLVMWEDPVQIRWGVQRTISSFPPTPEQHIVRTPHVANGCCIQEEVVKEAQTDMHAQHIGHRRR